MSDVLERVRRLVALAAGNENRGEAANAAIKACELIKRHGIELSEKGGAAFRPPPGASNPFGYDASPYHGQNRGTYSNVWYDFIRETEEQRRRAAAASQAAASQAKERERAASEERQERFWREAERLRREEQSFGETRYGETRYGETRYPGDRRGRSRAERTFRISITEFSGHLNLEMVEEGGREMVEEGGRVEPAELLMIEKAWRSIGDEFVGRKFGRVELVNVAALFLLMVEPWYLARGVWVMVEMPPGGEISF